MPNRPGNDDRIMAGGIGSNGSQGNSANDNGSQNGSSRSRSNRGFASMDRSKQREIASKGGRAAHQKGTAHEFDSSEARAAGRKGGVTVSRNREHMAAIGRRGGEARGANRAARLQGQTSSKSNGNSPNASQNGSNRFQGDREVGLGSSNSSQQQRASAQPQRPSGNSLGGEPRGASSDERNV